MSGSAAGTSDVVTPEIRGIIVAHGSLAAGLVAAATRISGVQEGVLLPVSNDGLGPDQLRDAILSDAGDGPAVVFTDLAAGSCTLAARVCCTGGAPLALVTGVNLAMILDFLFHRDMPIAELVEHVVSRGRDGVRALVAPSDPVPEPAPEPATGDSDPTDVDSALPR